MIWKIYFTVREFLMKCKRDNLPAFAAQAAFFIIISFIPFVMLFSSMLQYTPVTEGMILQLINNFMPDYIAPFMVSVIDEVYSRSVTLISVTAIAAIWSAAKGIQYMAIGFNLINGLSETRNWLVLRFWAIIYTAVFMIAVMFALILLVFGNSIHDLLILYIPFIASATEAVFRLRSLIVLIALVFAFAVLFRTLPNNRGLQRKLTIKNQMPGAIICAIAWYVFSFGLSVYVDYFNGFSIYGNLTTIVLVMLWLYFGMYIMLICVEINVYIGENASVKRKIKSAIGKVKKI